MVWVRFHGDICKVVDHIGDNPIQASEWPTAVIAGIQQGNSNKTKLNS